MGMAGNAKTRGEASAATICNALHHNHPSINQKTFFKKLIVLKRRKLTGFLTVRIASTETPSGDLYRQAQENKQKVLLTCFSTVVGWASPKGKSNKPNFKE